MVALKLKIQFLGQARALHWYLEFLEEGLLELIINCGNF